MSILNGARGIVVAQLGARGHYAVPRILNEGSRLAHFYTDICADHGWPRAVKWVPRVLVPKRLHGLVDRRIGAIPKNLVTSFPSFGVSYARKRRISNSSNMTEVHLDAARRFCEIVACRAHFTHSDIYACSCVALELFEAARVTDARRFLEQPSAPIEVELKLIAQERLKYPGWEADVGSSRAIDSLIERQHREWELATTILVPSVFVLNCIQSVGGPVEKCRIVPYGFDGMADDAAVRPIIDRPLRTLYVGSLRLQKGIQYLAEAAKLTSTTVDVRAVGPSSLSSVGLEAVRQQICYDGSVPRSRLSVHYRWADVLVFPSVCDGFGLVLLEALSYGVVVIATENSGVVVRDGIDGFVVQSCDARGIARCLDRLSEDRKLLLAMSATARSRAAEFSIENYKRTLLRAVESSEVH